MQCVGIDRIFTKDCNKKNPHSQETEILFVTLFDVDGFGSVRYSIGTDNGRYRQASSAFMLLKWKYSKVTIFDKVWDEIATVTAMRGQHFCGPYRGLTQCLQT